VHKERQGLILRFQAHKDPKVMKVQLVLKGYKVLLELKVL
jgi:hypothetical protein